MCELNKLIYMCELINKHIGKQVTLDFCYILNFFNLIISYI